MKSSEIDKDLVKKLNAKYRELLLAIGEEIYKDIDKRAVKVDNLVMVHTGNTKWKIRTLIAGVIQRLENVNKEIS